MILIANKMSKSRVELTFGSIGRDLGRLGVLSVLEEHVELANKEILGARQIIAHSHAQRELWILQHAVDVGYDVFLVDGYGQHLTFAIYADNTAR